MNSEELLQRIAIDPAVCHGQPCVKGTRVLVTVVLDALAAGLSAAEIVRHYPSITEQDVRSVKRRESVALPSRRADAPQAAGEF